MGIFLTTTKIERNELRMKRRLSISLFASLVLMLFASLTASASLQILGEVESGLNAQNQFYLHFETDGAANSQVTYNGHTTSEMISLDGLHTHVLTNAEPSTTYEYSIRLTDWFGGDETITGEVTTPALVSPKNIAVATSSETAFLRWHATFGAAEYIIVRADSTNGPFTEVGKVNTTSFVDNTVENGAEYHYQITAVASNGTKADPSDVISVVIVPALVSDDFIDINFDVWDIWGTNPNAVVETSDSHLRFSNFNVGAGWDNNQRGLVLREPISLAGHVTTITTKYTEANYNEQNVAFADAIWEDDIWNHNGFRLTVYHNRISSTGMSGGDASFTGINNVPVSAPYTLTWIIRDNGSSFGAEVLIDGQPAASGTINMGSLDPERLFFFLYVANDGNQGPTAIDSIVIEQEPVL